MRFIGDDGKDVYIVDFRIDYGRFHLVIFQDLDFLLDKLGLFELHIDGQSSHSMFEILKRGLEIPFDNFPYVLYLGMIVLRILHTLTWSLAIAQMIFKAYFIFARIDFFLGKIIIACP